MSSETRSKRQWMLVGVAIVAFAGGLLVAHSGALPFLGGSPTDDPGAAASGGGVKPPAGLRPGPAPTDPARGLWHPAARPPANSAAGRLRDITNLPYVGGSKPAPEVERVTVHDADAVHAGINLVVAGHAPSAQIVDMKGEVLHEWSMDFDEVWPGALRVGEFAIDRTFWRRAEVLPNGELLAIHDGIGMVKLDASSKLIWSYRGGCHHDLWVDEDGTITTLVRRWHAAVAPARQGFPTFLRGPYFEDFVVKLSPDGEELEALSIVECFENSDYGSVLTMAPTKFGDFTHTNTVTPMDGRFADRHPLYASGNLLVCVRDCNAVAVLDPRKKTVIWAMTGLWTRPHEPVIVEDGRLMIFDNLGARMQSRILEIDMFTQQIEWSYQGTPENPFSSEVCGSNQRLPNGNTLIVETNHGRAFEVTREGRIVWEYFTPHRSGENGELIASLFDCVRLDPARFAATFPGWDKSKR